MTADLHEPGLDLGVERQLLVGGGLDEQDLTFVRRHVLESGVHLAPLAGPNSPVGELRRLASHVDSHSHPQWVASVNELFVEKERMEAEMQELMFDLRMRSGFLTRIIGPSVPNPAWTPPERDDPERLPGAIGYSPHARYLFLGRATLLQMPDREKREQWNYPDNMSEFALRWILARHPPHEAYQTGRDTGRGHLNRYL
jgi:hypothetical protein